MAGHKLYDWSGSEFAVDTTTPGSQGTPSMAWASATSYVVVWQVWGVETEIRAQLFSAAGAKIGGEFTIGPNDGDTFNPAVAQLAGGGFVVAWEDGLGSPSGATLIRFQRYDSDGNEVGAEGVVQTHSGLAHGPAIAGLAGGGFVITWTDLDPGGPDPMWTGVHGQIFDAAGAAAGPAFLVNTIVEQVQIASSVAALPGGGFAVVWQDGSPQGVQNGFELRPDYGTDIAIQIFDAAGNKLGPQRVVDEMVPFARVHNAPVGHTTASRPVITMLTDGRLAVVWEEFTGEIKTRILAADGTPLTGVVVCGEGETVLEPPAITALSDGGYAVSWTAEMTGPPDASAGSVRVAVYDSTGARQGDAFVANETVDGAQGQPAMLGLPGGGFAMAWKDGPAGSDAGEIVGRHFAPDAGAITDIAFLGSISQTAVENIMVGRLSAEGALNGLFSYQILSDSSGAFRVEGDRLVVDDTLRLAAHDGDSVTLELRVTDSNGNSWEETLEVPIGRPASGTLYVAEDQSAAASSLDFNSLGLIPDLLMLAGGRILLTWTGWADGIRPYDIFGQLFEADGTPVAEPFIVNTQTNGNEFQPDLAALADGGFVATWASSNGDGTDNYGVRAQLFDSDGDRIASEFAVNTNSQSSQRLPGVTDLAGGGFFVAWVDYAGVGVTDTQGAIKGQFFTASGARVGGELPVAEVATFQEMTPTVTELASGRIIVAWTEYSYADGSPGEIRATLLNADGSVAVDQFRVNATTLDHWNVSSATALAGGGFVIVWRDTNLNSEFETNQYSSADIRGQIYDADGQPVGAELLINQDSFGAQADPMVVASPSGGFTVTWSGWSRLGGDDDLVSVIARGFAADGSPEGNQFLVDQLDQIRPSTPTAAYLPSGDLAFAWWDLQIRLNDGSLEREIATRLLRAVGEVVNGTADCETIQGGERIDVISGNGGDDIIGGGGGDDLLRGGEGKDELWGEAGDDLLDGGLGGDAMAGGCGNDVYVVDNEGDIVTELAGEGIDEIRTGLGSKAPPERAVYVLPDFIENLTGTSAGAQGVRDNALDNVIAMGGGHDLIVVDAGGVDTVSGGGGNDFIYHGDKLTAADITNGGAGVDTIALLGDYAAGLVFTAANLVGVERMALYTGGGANSYAITMHDANVAAGAEFFATAASLQSSETLTFNGAAESDGRFTIHGGAGNDTIVGGAGGDFFIGNASNDSLFGLGGIDFLIGGLGADQLRGGAGSDRFVYQSSAQSTAGSVDRILDFQHVDRIDLTGIDANGNAADGDSAFTFIGSSAFGNAAGQLRAYQSGPDWFVEGDTNGDGLADLIIQVTLPDATPLGAADFIL